MNEIDFFRSGVDVFDSKVHGVTAEDWDKDSPNPGWSIRDLVNHVVGELRWIQPILAGKTIDDVGDALDGDLLGHDPERAWEAARNEAFDAVGRLDDVQRVVHLSFGDVPAAEYLKQVASDNVIHAWDLARGVGIDESLDAEAVEETWSYMSEMAEMWRSGGAFGPAVTVPDSADLQTRLLALTGRRP